MRNNPKLPKTGSIQTLAEFWDTHDLTDFEDELEAIGEPVFGEKAADTGEGTRYGRRAKRPDKAHVHPPRKPQQ